MSSVARIVITGAEGQVGWEACRAFAGMGQVIPLTRRELDLARHDTIEGILVPLRPDLIVNAAAYTAVDRAETEPELATAVNATAPGRIGDAARRAGAAVLHFSTDYVFDGTSERPYREDDAPSPLNVYGRTKCEGERALRGSGARALTVRTSWVYAARGHNFVRTMLRLARERDELRVVADQYGCPTSAAWLSRQAARLGALLLDREAEAPGVDGILHVRGGGPTTWHALAEAALAADPRRAEQTCRRVTPIATSEYPTPARRPARSVLDVSIAEQRHGIVAPDWRAELAGVLAA